MRSKGEGNGLKTLSQDQQLGSPITMCRGPFLGVR